ncbi:hypothetical protein AN958_02432 [Leucoagaricus sp. SymC.cos]|nr:hypothetical protein AN958_02432 [Leucoagaricus sp. SymC.cos]
MTDTGHKRKRPPTFQHYPTKRAKKLKKAWVETAKIKSKWRAQKRREGIESLRVGIPPQEREDPRRDVDSADNKSEKRHLARDKNNTDTKNAAGNVDDKPSLRALFQKAGQPNMRLRMNAMLEKIKRDFS